MAEATIAVYGIFYESALAKSSVEQLLAAHFAEDDVTVKDPQILGTKDISDDRDSKAGSSTAVVTSSVAVGGALGLAVGVGALAIPGIGPLLVAGPLLGALAGMGAGGAVGGAIDAVDSATTDEGARRYEGHIREGGILVTVQCVDAPAITLATEVLHRSGAQAISHA
jgi:hypothetical protein